MPNTHICPAEKILIKGPCNVITCIAHDKKSESGCIYGALKEISMYNVGNRLKLTNPEIKRQYKKGVKILTDAAKFYHLATQSFIAPLHYCPNCGIAGTECINLVRCEKRKKFGSKQLKRIPMQVLTSPALIWFWPTVSNPELQEFFTPKVMHRALKLMARKTV